MTPGALLAAPLVNLTNAVDRAYPWLWLLGGVATGALVVGGVVLLSTMLWVQSVRRVWNAPELSEGFFRRFTGMPRRFRDWLRGTNEQTGALDRIWGKFQAQLPPAVRARLLDIPTVILLGSQRAGKTSLIDAHVDWSAMQGHFLPSLRDERLPLRISLGSRLLVQELAAAVLESDAPATANALTRLWGPLCRLQKPLVVVAIDVNRLSPERLADPAAAAALVNEARMLVGKVGLLSRLSGGQIKLRIALTHLDAIPGYACLERFCAAEHLPLRVALSVAHAQSGGASELLALYRRHLPLALLRCKPEDFAGIVRFLHEMPLRLRALEPYFAELVRDPTRRLAPSLDRLYFFSKDSAQSSENPFQRAASQEPHKRGARAWLTRILQGRRHLLLAVTGALAIGTVLAIGVWSDGRRVDAADETLQKLARAIKRTAGSRNPPYASSELHTLLGEAGRQLHEIERSDAARLSLNRVLRQKRKQQARDVFIESVRDSQLLPLLERYRGRQRDDLMLFTLAALHASSHNSLGALMMPHLGEWVRRLDLPPAILSDYVHFCDRPYENRTRVKGIFSHGAALLAGLDQQHIWYEQLVTLEKFFAARSLDPVDLAKLREQLRPFVSVVDGLGRDPLVGQVYRVLSEVAPWSVAEIQGARGFALAPPAWLLDQLPAFRGVLHLVNDSTGERGAAPQNLYQALRLLVETEGKTIPDEVFVIDLEGRQFSFSARQWLELLRRSRKGAVVRSLFASSEKPATGQRPHRRSKKKKKVEVSFAPPADAPPGKEQYSPEVLRRDIVPILRDLDAKLEQRSSLSPEQRKALELFVKRESQRYARGYCDDLRTQYGQFSLRGNRIETTLAALRGLLPKDGTLVTHLKETAARADLGQLEGAYLEPLRACLAPFQPVVKLAALDKEGNMAELKPYEALIAELIKLLEAPPAKVTEDGSKVELKDALPQAGRIALAVLEGQPENMRQKFLRLLQERQIAEPLQGPFLAPLRHVLGMGESELQRTLARLWEQGPRRQLSLFDLYPFRRASAAEATVAEIDVLRPQQGAFWAAFLPIFQPVCIKQNGRWKARPLPGGTPWLPSDLLPLVNRAEEVSRRLFTPEGQRQILTLSVRALPPSGLPEGTTVVRSFLISGKSGRSAFVPSGVQTVLSLPVDWAQPSVAAVGVDLQVGSAPQTQSLDGPESPWSLFRLIERAQLEDKTATWRLPGGEGKPEIEVSFTFSAAPFGLFHAAQGGE
jgi:hypothetical protein